MLNAPLGTSRLVLPLVAISLGAGTLQVGIIISVMTALPIFFAVSFGRWADRVGTLIPFAVSGGIVILAGILFVVFPSSHTLLVTSSLVGAGGMFAHVVAARAVADLGPAEGRASRLGLLVLSYPIGQFLGPMLAAAVFERHGSNAALLTLAAFGTAAILGLSVLPHNFTRNGKRSIDTGPKPKAFELMKDPSLRAVIIVNGVFYGAVSIYPVVLSLHSLDAGLSATQAGLILGAFAAGNVTARLGVGVVLRWLSAEKALVVALISSGLAYALFPLLHSVPALAGLGVVLGLALGLANPTALSLIYGTAPQGRLNESLGLAVSFGNFLQTLLPLVLGVVVTGAGLGAMVWLLSLSMLATSLLLRARRR